MLSSSGGEFLTFAANYLFSMDGGGLGPTSLVIGKLFVGTVTVFTLLNLELMFIRWMTKDSDFFPTSERRTSEEMKFRSSKGYNP